MRGYLRHPTRDIKPAARSIPPPAPRCTSAELVAATRGEKLSQLVVQTLAEKVSDELASARTWKLTIPEQTELLRILAAKPVTSRALTRAVRQAARLFDKGAVHQR